MKQNHIVMLGVMGLISAGISGCGAFDDGSMDGFAATHASAPANSEDESVIPTPAMPEPESKCHVESLSNGARIWCDDGTSVSILNGLSGNHGNDGVDGQNGADAEPCTTTQTELGATLACPDGSSGYVLNGIDGSDGVDGISGIDGIDGLNGTDGIDGLNGADGVDGIDGTSCTSVQTVTGAEIQCSDGTVASIQNGLDGAAGTDGVDGLNGTDGVDGIDGTSCTVLQDASGATISCSDGSTVSLLNGVDGLNGTDGVDATVASTTTTIENSGYDILQLSDELVFLVNTESTDLTQTNIWLLADGVAIPALNDADGLPLYTAVVYDAATDSINYVRASDLYTCEMSITTGISECTAQITEPVQNLL